MAMLACRFHGPHFHIAPLGSSQPPPLQQRHTQQHHVDRRRLPQRHRLRVPACTAGPQRAPPPPPPPLNHAQQPLSAAVLTRRQQLLSAAALALTAAASQPRAWGSGILQFPLNETNNTYFLVRAGESEAEAQGIVLTNPVAKTSQSVALSREGRRQVAQSTYRQLRQLGLDEACWIWPSITQNAYQTAEVLAEQLYVGRSRIVPEFSFLDARGVGELERLPLGEVAAALAAGDSLAPTWRPSPNVDGTVHESSADVLVRVRQLLSILETQYLGETVLIVSPDSDNLSVLQAAVLGIDLRGHHSLAFAPGEARRLQLSSEPREEPPTSLACPRPPQCL